MHLKPNTRAEFTQTLEKEIIPLLRKQKGFQDEIAFVAAETGTLIVAISLWDTKEDAQAYQRAVYPEVLKTLSKVVEGTPEVRDLEVTNSTFQKTATLIAA
jgi:heme-degrading monooxygenase HmoA